MRKYYAGVAMRENGTLYFTLRDHLGSTALTIDSNGSKVAELRYMPFGETRYVDGATPTDYRYTGQLEEGEIGLMFYNARWYDPQIGRFISADSVVPGVGNPQAYDRFSYVFNNPIRYTDPSGHILCSPHRPNCEEEYQLTPPDPQQHPPIPPITYDNNNGLCINAGNIGCSGTVESNLEWINWNVSMLPYEAERRYSSAEWWNDTSVILTDAAFASSSAGAAVEVTFTAAGATGGPFGAFSGAVLGNITHQVVFNPVETILSTGATLTTVFGADPLAGNTSFSVQNGAVSVVVGEASVTTVILQTIGNAVPIGVIDAAIDGYSSAYSHGQAPGVLSLLGLNGQTFNLGPISITLGK